MQTLVAAQLNDVASVVGSILPVIEKGGITAFALGICWYLWRENDKKAKELVAVYKQRDQWRAAFQDAKGKIELLKLKLGQSVDLDIEEPTITDIPT